MMNFISKILEGIGSIGSSFGTNACFVWYVDEPECPKSLIK